MSIPDPMPQEEKPWKSPLERSPLHERYLQDPELGVSAFSTIIPTPFLGLYVFHPPDDSVASATRRLAERLYSPQTPDRLPSQVYRPTEAYLLFLLDELLPYLLFQHQVGIFPEQVCNTIVREAIRLVALPERWIFVEGRSLNPPQPRETQLKLWVEVLNRCMDGVRELMKKVETTESEILGRIFLMRRIMDFIPHFKLWREDAVPSETRILRHLEGDVDAALAERMERISLGTLCELRQLQRNE
jgi:hypothetical protein